MVLPVFADHVESGQHGFMRKSFDLKMDQGMGPVDGFGDLGFFFKSSSRMRPIAEIICSARRPGRSGARRRTIFRSVSGPG
jgi:hypothetical protein